MADINHRAPWQFYMQLLPQWTLLQDFLKGAASGPTGDTLLCDHNDDDSRADPAGGKLLAEKAAAITFLKQPDIPATMRKRTSQLLVASIYAGGVIDWDRSGPC
ncbi:MAG: hypothetical protein ACLSH6_06790 [Limosilactobacillus pontis]